jgi:hypothetical protein
MHDPAPYLPCCEFLCRKLHVCATQYMILLLDAKNLFLFKKKTETFFARTCCAVAVQLGEAHDVEQSGWHDYSQE